MDAAVAARIIKAAAAKKSVAFSVHVRDVAMPADGVTVDDVLHILRHHDELHGVSDDGRKWKAVGNLLSLLRYAVIVRIRAVNDVVIVITAHPNTRGVS
jgi:hypothetical protein